MTAKVKLELLESCGYGPKVMMRLKVCPHCGKMVSRKHLYCPDCQMRLFGKTLYDRYRERHLCCDRCKTVLTADSRFCPHCGRSLYLNAKGEKQQR